ncbi:hypothetical protein SEA_ZOOMAN_260 [Microbacterium phage Zooman]|nr:hypothetical protein SEA_ZOOMAN_260 [Microbacterium phage Zooman]
MIETVVWAMIASTSVGTLVAAHLQYLVVRRNKAVAEQKMLEPARPATISQEMRDEIEQNEAWWLRAYHELMLRSGATVVARIHGMEYTTRNWADSYTVAHKSPDRVSLEGCICPECASVLREYEREEAALDSYEEEEISLDNRVLVAEIQRAYGHVPDGIAGVRTMNTIRTGWTTRPLSPEARQLIERYKGAAAEVRNMPSNVTQMSRGGVTMTAAPMYTPSADDLWELARYRKLG